MTNAIPSIHWRVGEILKSRSMTVEDLANKSGLHYKTALAIANDRSERIGKETLAKICEALNISPADVICLTEKS